MARSVVALSTCFALAALSCSSPAAPSAGGPAEDLTATEVDTTPGDAPDDAAADLPTDIDAGPAPLNCQAYFYCALTECGGVFDQKCQEACGPFDQASKDAEALMKCAATSCAKEAKSSNPLALTQCLTYVCSGELVACVGAGSQACPEILECADGCKNKAPNSVESYDCFMNCLAKGSVSERKTFGQVMGCLAGSCLDVNATKFDASACPSPPGCAQAMAACFAHGTEGCKQVDSCYGKCTTDTCHQACLGAGSAQAVEKFMSFAECAVRCKHCKLTDTACKGTCDAKSCPLVTTGSLGPCD